MTTETETESLQRLKIYLQDHYAGSVAGVELARRCHHSNPDGELGEFLARLIVAIESDRDALAEIMEALGCSPAPAKNVIGWASEKMGRLKLNGQLFGYSPLSRLIELEGLTLGVRGKLALWTTLSGLTHIHQELGNFDLDGLIASATQQVEDLEGWRSDAGMLAFG